MKIKRYTDSDRRRVMDRVRSEMGADAVILSSKVTEDGFSLVACNLDEQLLDQQIVAGKERSLSLVVDEPARPAAQDQANVDSLQEELNKLRTLIEVELPRVARRGLQPQPGTRDLTASLVTRLERFGFSNAFAKTLRVQVGDIRDSQRAWQKALQIVERRLCDERELGFNLSGHYALVGPAGSGKTATLCKLAIRGQQLLGADAVAIISVDRKRFGAHQQIGQFAKYMKLPALRISSWRDLGRAVEAFSDKKLVLIDTPSLQQGDDLGPWVEGLKETRRKVHGLYCFAATSSREILLDHARMAKASGFSAVVTRADECRSLAPSLEALARTSLPLAYLCDGTRIRKDIHSLTSTQLLQRSLKLYKETRSQQKYPLSGKEISA